MKAFVIGLVMASMSLAACSAPREDRAESVSRDVAKEEANRKIVLEMFKASNVDEITKNMTDDYKQHNPNIADGKKGAVEFFTNLFKRYPNQKARVIHVAADGDFVWVHAHLTLTPDDPGLALVDIWRLKDGKLAEHWDIMQPVPGKTASGNSMF